jgi:hypothetical protein
MVMKLKRAISFGALLWVLIFFEVSILMFGLKLEPSALYYTIHYILLAALTFGVAWLYFKGKIEAGIKEGLLVGIVCLLTGIVLDVIITIPLFVKSYSFFADIYLWIGFLETIVIFAIIGKIKE